MDNFIYVFTKSDRDRLLSLGFTILKADESTDIYVFVNNGQQKFTVDDMKFALSDTLTFLTRTINVRDLLYPKVVNCSMGERTMRIVFSSSISDLTEKNSSFDRGILRVAYTGRNRNNSFISKETFERCMPSIYNCPIVCRYDREEDVIGSHDMDLVSDGDGGLRIVNITHPVGVIPESAQYWWEEIEDDSGVHEYLCVDALIWKRQEAYKKIKEDGITDESMEISIKEGEW